MSLVLASQHPALDRDLLFEQAASCYLDLYEEVGKPPKMLAVLERLCDKHSEYDRRQVAEILATKEFSDYLMERRRRHLLEGVAARMVAAEMGAIIGTEALDVLKKRLREDPDSITTRDLIALARLGMEMNAGVDKDLAQATGDVKIAIQLKDVLVGLPPERAAVLMAEYGRMMAAPKNRQVIDGSCDEATA